MSTAHHSERCSSLHQLGVQQPAGDVAGWAAMEMVTKLNPDDCVILFADLQSSLVANSGTLSPKRIEAGAGALADAGAVLDIPMIFSVVPENGRAATLLPSLSGHVADASRFTRQCASPFMDEALVRALQETGRRTLVLAGYATEAVVLFAALDALEAGYRVIVALDAGGGNATRTEEAALRRIERAGATVTSVVDVLMSCAPDFARDPGKPVFEIVHAMMPARD